MTKAGLPRTAALFLLACAAVAPGDAVALADGGSPSPILLTDAKGRDVAFAAPPERIVIAGRGLFMITDALYLFPEAPRRIAAMGRDTQSERDFLPLVDPDFAAKVFLESEAAAEQIAPLRPDVVLLKRGIADRLGASLERLDIPVVYLDLETPEQYQRDIRLLGRLLGDPDRAETVCRFYEERLRAVERCMTGLPEIEKPRVLLLQHMTTGGETGYAVPPASWIQTTMVSRAGGRPVWTEGSAGLGWTVVGMEQIAAWDPDQVFVVSYRGDAEEIVEKMKTNGAWRALRAVKTGELHGFPADARSWDQPDTRWPLGLLWLATKIHPERTGSIDMAAEVLRFYSELYGLDPDVIRARVLPILESTP
jgi:iron complex transport system substrate-binding protein